MRKVKAKVQGDTQLLKALIRQMARNMRRFDGSTPEKQRLAVMWLQNDLAVLADIVAQSITPHAKKKGKANG